MAAAVLAHVAIVTLCAATPPALAGGFVVDGISEPELTSWLSSPFGATYGETWFNSSHITNARLILYLHWTQSEKELDAEAEGVLEPWLDAVRSWGLSPDIVMSTVNGPGVEAHPGQNVYRGVLASLLRWAANVDPIAYVEPWNEPNSQGGLSSRPELAADYANQAYTACEADGCTVIAGNFDDITGEMAAYERTYTGHLTHAITNWGIHPYFAVNAEFKGLGGGEWRSFKPELPNEGAGDVLWITEVSAYRSFCTPEDEAHETPPETVSEEEQAAAASYLVNTFGPAIGAAHAFYYDPVRPETRPNTCRAGLFYADNALYQEGGDPNTEYSPRPAAWAILDEGARPWAYTGTMSDVNPPDATLSGSVYPGAADEARYHFEYGTSASYGSYGAEAGTAASSGWKAVSTPVRGLRPAVIYHYRLVAWNSEGVGYGPDEIAVTPAQANLLGNPSSPFEVAGPMLDPY